MHSTLREGTQTDTVFITGWPKSLEKVNVVAILNTRDSYRKMNVVLHIMETVYGAFLSPLLA